MCAGDEDDAVVESGVNKSLKRAAEERAKSNGDNGLLQPFQMEITVLVPCSSRCPTSKCISGVHLRENEMEKKDPHEGDISKQNNSSLFSIESRCIDEIERVRRVCRSPGEEEDHLLMYGLSMALPADSMIRPRLFVELGMMESLVTKRSSVSDGGRMERKFSLEIPEDDPHFKRVRLRQGQWGQRAGVVWDSG